MLSTSPNLSSFAFSSLRTMPVRLSRPLQSLALAGPGLNQAMLELVAQKSKPIEKVRCEQRSERCGALSDGVDLMLPLVSRSLTKSRPLGIQWVRAFSIKR